MDFTLSKSPGTQFNNSKQFEDNASRNFYQRNHQELTTQVRHENNEKASKFMQMQNDITRLQDKIRGLENKLETRGKRQQQQSESGAQTDRIFENQDQFEIE